MEKGLFLAEGPDDQDILYLGHFCQHLAQVAMFE